MGKLLGSLFLLIGASLVSASSLSIKAPKTANKSSSSVDEFLALSEPHKSVSGAYYGLGLALSMMSHKARFVDSSVSKEVNLKKTANQFDVSLIGGFGAPFYEKYYAGIEFDFFKRFPSKKSYESELGIIHTSTLGLNMDVRFGYLFPEHGSMLYLTVGFARALGHVAHRNQLNKESEGSFGSFFPAFGAGLEYKINHKWNIRGDFRILITSKENKKNLCNWQYEAKPNRIAFRISVTRNL
ncbi:MAG: porin family protein [Holosporaceae bacterium]|jgi:hypothetical protein|nr:porin family protein [Holosporaceae bacterium]